MHSVLGTPAPMGRPGRGGGVTSAGTLPPRPGVSPSLGELLPEVTTWDPSGFANRPPREDRPTQTGAGTVPRKEPHLGVSQCCQRLPGKQWPQLGSPLSKVSAPLSLWEASCAPAREPFPETSWSLLSCPLLPKGARASRRAGRLALPSPRSSPVPPCSGRRVSEKEGVPFLPCAWSRCMRLVTTTVSL